jgi:hypothetical protein
MYSQNAISSRSRGRAEPTEEMISGLVCVVCRADYRTAPATDAMVVSHHNDHQLLACRGVCARMASGSTAGLDETPPPLAERVRKHSADPS